MPRRSDRGALLALTLLAAGCAQPGRVDAPVPVAPFPAVALAVEAGDVVVLRHARSQRIERVRLAGIDAPEADQPHGTAAATALRRRLSGASLIVSATGRAPDGSLAGWVCVTEVPYFERWSYPACNPAESVNRALVEAGQAWAEGDAADSVAEAQRLARSQRAGLWADPGPVPPWQWRALDPGRRGAILAARGPVPAAPPPGSTPTDVSWLFGAEPARATDAPGGPGAWRQHWEGLLRELF